VGTPANPVETHSTNPEGERLLVFAPTGRDSELAVKLLREGGFAAQPCADADELLRVQEFGIGALIIAEEALTPEFARRLLELFDAQPPWSDLPALVLTRSGRHGISSHPLAQMLARPNVTLLERPLKTYALYSVVTNALAARRRQYEIRSLLENLEEKVRERDRFLSMLSHELRNPLSAITSALELLHRTDSQATERPALQIALRQTRAIARMLNDLLDVSRFANGKMSLYKAPVRLSDVIAMATDASRPNIGQKRQHFTTSIERDVILDGDQVRLAQLFSNLLVNASKFTDEEGEINLSCKVNEAMVETRVKDNGIGIGPELIPGIFEPFVQSTQGIDRSQGGLGLGLALAKGIAEAHGGSIEAAGNASGLGSEFIVRLPISEQQSDAVCAEQSESKAARPIRILVVEDDLDAASSLEALLRELGHDVHVAGDGAGGLAAATPLQPQVVLLDIGLPGMSGYELAQRLRMALPREVQLVAISGYGQAEDLRRSKECGIDHHLVKPVNLEDLETILNAVPPQ